MRRRSLVLAAESKVPTLEAAGAPDGLPQVVQQLPGDPAPHPGHHLAAASVRDVAAGPSSSVRRGAAVGSCIAPGLGTKADSGRYLILSRIPGQDVDDQHRPGVCF